MRTRKEAGRWPEGNKIKSFLRNGEAGLTAQCEQAVKTIKCEVRCPCQVLEGSEAGALRRTHAVEGPEAICSHTRLWQRQAVPMSLPTRHHPWELRPGMEEQILTPGSRLRQQPSAPSGSR